MRQKTGWWKENISFVVFVVLLSLLVVASGVIVALKQMRGENESVLNVSIGNGTTSGEYTIEELHMKPGESVEYTLKIQADVTGKYALKWHFTTTGACNMQEYVIVEIETEQESIAVQSLHTLLGGEEIEWETSLTAGEEAQGTLRYVMPLSVGNEAQGTEANFSFSISSVMV